MTFESLVDHICDSPIDGICSWCHSCLCLYLTHFDDHMGMKPPQDTFLPQECSCCQVIHSCNSFYVNMDETYNEYTCWPWMLMPFSHSLFPKRRQTQAHLEAIVCCYCAERSQFPWNTLNSRPPKYHVDSAVHLNQSTGRSLTVGAVIMAGGGETNIELSLSLWSPLFLSAASLFSHQWEPFQLQMRHTLGPINTPFFYLIIPFLEIE